MAINRFNAKHGLSVGTGSLGVIDVLGNIEAQSIGVTGSITPAASGVYDLGSPTKSWRNIYISGISGSLTGSGLEANSIVFAGSGGVLTGSLNQFSYNPSTGNVAIGTNVAMHRLDVGGTIHTNSDIFANGTVYGGNASITNTLTAPALSGSLTKLSNGSSYLIAGSNVSITTGSSGAVTIATSNLVGGSGTTNYVSKFTGTSTLGNSAIYDDGSNIGIGTNSPATLLNIRGNSPTFSIDDSISGTSSISFRPIASSYAERAGISVNYSTGEFKFSVGAVSNAYYQTFYTNGSERARIDTVGNVGIGSTTITARLHVSGSSTASTPTMIVREGVAAPTGGAGAFDVQNSTGTSILFVSGSGFVGIGTSSPQAQLQISRAGGLTNAEYIRLQNTSTGGGSSCGITFWQNNAGTAVNRIEGTVTSGGSYDLSMSGYNGSTLAEILRLQGSTANVGIGTMNPVARLYVTGSSTTTTPTMVVREGVVAPQGGAGTFDVQNSSGTSLLFVSGSGNVGVGITNPSVRLHVLGGAQENTILASTTTQSYMSIRYSTSSIAGYLGTAQGLVTGGVSADIALRSESGNVIFTTGATERVRINTSGNVGIGTTLLDSRLVVNGNSVFSGSVNPDGDLTRDLGSSTKRWQNLYAANIIGSLTGSNLTSGQVVVAGTGGLLSGSNNFWWDNTNTRVGIGTANPSDRLVVENSSADVTARISAGASALYAASLAIGTKTRDWTLTAANGSSNYLLSINYTGSDAPVSNIFVFTKVGNVGIGTSSYTARLHVSGSSAASTPTMVVKEGTIPADATGAFDVQNYLGTSLLFVSGSGRVGIGVITPNAALDVLSAASGASEIRSSGNNVYQVFRRSTNTTVGYIGSGASLVSSGGSNSDFGIAAPTAGTNLILVTGATERARIDSTGNLLPGADNTYDLGSTTKRWTNLYATNISGSITGSNLTSGQVVVAGTGGLLSGSNNFWWDNTNARVGIGITSSAAKLAVNSSDNSGVGPTVDINGAMLRVGDGISSLDFSGGGVGIKIHDQGVEHWTVGQLGSKFLISQTGTSSDTLFPANRSDWFTILNGSGNVGIGTSSPGATFAVSGSSVAARPTMTVREGVASPTGGAGIFNVQNSAGTSLLFVSGSGRVGIGTINPTTPLHVNATGTGLSGTGFRIADFSQDQTNGRGIMLGYDSSGQIGLIAPNSTGPVSSLAFWTNSATGWGERMRLDSAGNLLVRGTTQYGSAKLQVGYGDDSNAAQGYSQIGLQYFGGGYSHFIQSLHNAVADDGNAIRFYLNTSGTAAGSSAIGTGNALSYFMGYSTHRWNTGGSERMRIDSTGNVGIGTTIPSQRLDIASGSMRGLYYLSTYDGELLAGADAGGYYYGTGFGKYTAIPMFIGSNATNIIFGAGSAERMRIIGSTGNVAIGAIPASALSRLYISGSSTSSTSVLMVRAGVASPSARVFDIYDVSNVRVASIDHLGNIYATSGSFTGDVSITGNLTVAGTQTIVNSSTVNIGDNIILLNSTASPQQYGGIYVADTTANTTGSLLWDSNTNAWVAGLAGSEVALPTGTGTSGMVTRWTGTNTLGTGVIYDNGTNVGVGSASDGTKLYVKYDNASSYTATGFNTSTLHLRNGTGVPDSPTMMTFSSNWSGAGWYLGLVEANTAYQANFVFQTRTGASTAAERMRIDINGNVGIGATNPSNLLTLAKSNGAAFNLEYDSAGNARTGLFLTTRGSSHGIFSAGAEWNDTDSQTIARSAASSAMWMSSGITRFFGDTGLTIGNTFTPSERVRIDASGNVGINTTSMTLKLEVSGSDARIHDVRVGRGPGSIISNTVVGNGALQSNVSGVSLTAVGQQALYYSTGNSNTAVGQNAAVYLGSGASNTAVGNGALYSSGTPANNTGNNNVAIGAQSFSAMTSGGSNVAIGNQAGYLNTTGNYNFFGGFSAGYNNTTATGNVFLGYQAGLQNISGSYNVAVGYQAGYSSTTSGYLTSVGTNSNLFQTGTGLVAIGYGALQGVSGQSIAAYNTAIGHGAGFSTTTGYGNFFGGYQAGTSNSVGFQGVMIGFQAGLYVTSGSYNTLIGYSAGSALTTGEANTFVGRTSGTALTTESYNTLIGMNAGRYYKAAQNTAVGYSALNGVDGGFSTGTFNTAVGGFAGANVTSGGSNTFVGHQAGVLSSVATNNVMLGYQAGYNITSGSNNVTVGFQAGDTITTGANNIVIGSGADVLGATNNNSIVIGQGAQGLGTNTTVLGNSSTTTTYIPGNVGVNTTTPQGAANAAARVLQVYSSDTSSNPAEVRVSGNAGTSLSIAQGTAASYLWSTGNFPLTIGTNGASKVSIDTTGHVTPAADNTQNLGSPTLRWANVYATNITASGSLGPSYTSPSSTSGGTAIYDTASVATDGAVYELMIIGNPNSNGSLSYRDVVYGKIIIGTGYNGATVRNYIQFVCESPAPRSLYSSGGGPLTADVVYLQSGTEYTDIAQGGTATIRVKVSGYYSGAGGIYVGNNTTVRLKQLA